MQEDSFSFDTYLSPFTWRYGSREMRRIFSEKYQRALWRRIWFALAEAQSRFGLVSKEELDDLKAHLNNIDLKRAHQIEEEIGHDLMAEIRTFAEQAKIGGGRIHLGATSMDIEDNADILRFREALQIIIMHIIECLEASAEKIKQYKDMPAIGWTHLQPAEPTTLGYRFASYAQDFLLDLKNIELLIQYFMKGKGFKGAVGTSASYEKLLKNKIEASKLEDLVLQKLGIKAFTITTQTYPRKLDYLLLSALASVAQSCHKFALDVRILQSPPFGELSEPIREKQVGSSTMAFKRNPVSCERICSLARYIGILAQVGFANASNTMLERTLDDSANRRIILPQSFLALDECLRLYLKVVKGLIVYESGVRRNLERYGVFAGTEAVMMNLVKKGEDRQKVHERIRQHSFKAWEKLQATGENPLPSILKDDKEILAKLSKEELDELLDPTNYLGDASQRCIRFIREELLPTVDDMKRILSPSSSE